MKTKIEQSKHNPKRFKKMQSVNLSDYDDYINDGMDNNFFFVFPFFILFNFIYDSSLPF